MKITSEAFTWKMISDPLYGYVYFNVEIEEPVVNSILLQRLRYIMQLQTAHLVYPGAVHTRFQHSIGTMHLAGLVIEDMVSKIISMYGKEGLDGYEPVTLIQAVRLASLLHDVGHAAFSHAFEYGVLWKRDIPREVSNHEDIGLILVKQLLSDTLDKVEKQLPGVRDILFTILGRDRPRGILKFLKWLIRSGHYPVDVLDFLRRDSYYAGTTEYGSIQYERLYRNTYLLVDREAVVLDRIALGEFKQYMNARAGMYEHVYYHSVCRSFDKILYEILDLLDREIDLTGRVVSILKGDPRGYLELTDNYIYEIIMHKALYDNSKTGSLCRRLLVERKPWWKRVGREIVISANRGIDSLEKVLRLILDPEYRSVVTKQVEEYIVDYVSDRDIERDEIWLDVLDITPIPKTTLYPENPGEQGSLELFIGKKIGRSVNISEKFNVLAEELPLKIIFRVYVVRDKYSGELESLVTSTLYNAVTDILKLDLKAYIKIIEDIYSSYSGRDYSKFKITT